MLQHTSVAPAWAPRTGLDCVMDVLAETVLLWTYVEGLMPRRWQVGLGRGELLPYLLPRVMTHYPSNCVLKQAGSHQQVGKGFRHAAQQATEMGQAERQVGFYRTLML